MAYMIPPESPVDDNNNEVSLDRTDVFTALINAFGELRDNTISLDSVRAKLDVAIDESLAAYDRSRTAKLLELDHLYRQIDADPALRATISASYESIQDTIRQSWDNALATAAGATDEIYNKDVLNKFLGNMGRAAGPAGIGYDIYQIDQAMDTGNVQEVGLAVAKTIGVFAAAAGVSLVIGATIPVAAAAAIVAGVSLMTAAFIEYALPEEWKEAIGDFAIDLAGWMSEVYDHAIAELGEAFDHLTDLISDEFDEIAQDVNELFSNARNWILRRDPLTLDLDGDGLETIGIDPNNPILFDHDGDGTANATGWVKPDDGYLVFDRNENGLIDNGTELFGDSTPLLDENGEVVGQAVDGFAALAAEDTNGDGIVDANDANWDKLRVWQDLNSDGKTDEGELKTLEELGIAGFHVAKEENTQVLSNGNAVADLGSYIRTDGSEGTLGEVTGNMADIDLIDNPFYREFSDTIPLTEQAKTLADMQGSGNVRDLREASSLSSTLANSVESYSAAETKAEQFARVDDLIEKWAASSNNPTSIEQAEAQGYRLQYLVLDLMDKKNSQCCGFNSVEHISRGSEQRGKVVGFNASLYGIYRCLVA